tara:strand:+ start:671 stop:1420 length:750 start_codon:yes stop_codon:yes gene_type:complete
MNKFLIVNVFLLTSFYYSCEKSTENAVDNKITLTKEERVQQRWDNRIDSVSYAIGLDVAMRLEQQFDKFNHKRINQAIDDYYSGSNLYLNDKERVSVINLYNKLIAPRFRMDLEKKNMIDGASFLKENKKKPGIIEHRSGIQYKIIKNSNGKKPESTDVIKIHYTGKLIDGRKFDSSYDRGTPASFPVSRVIPGWSQGLQLMTVGSTYEFFIPGHLAYAQNDGPGGPGATLIFQVELLDILELPENKTN